MQVYPQGWQRIRSLMSENPTAAKVYAVLAEHIDPSCGAVVVSQTFWRKWSACPRGPSGGRQHTEEVLALVRIRVSGSVYAYALDPKEVWRAWDCQKEQAAFLTRTLVKKNGQNALVKRRLQMMLREQTGSPSCSWSRISIQRLGGSGIVRCSNFQNDKFVYSLHKLQRRSASVSVCSSVLPEATRSRPGFWLGKPPDPLSPRKENDHALRHLPTREDQDGAGPDRFRQPHDASGGHAER